MFSLLFFFRRKIKPGIHIDKGDLVIDIGSGDKPFWRADVFFDNLLLGNDQRISNSETIHNLGLFFDGDIIDMPFRNHAFDFSFCSHLLEHVENPALALNEMMRVSRGGYIEVPNAMIEYIKPFHSHLWFLYNINNELVFVRKSKLMHDINIKNGKRYRYLIDKINNPFISFYWKDKIKYKIVNNLLEEDIFIADNIDKSNDIIRGNNLYILFIKIFRYLFYKKKEIIKKDLMKFKL